MPCRVRMPYVGVFILFGEGRGGFSSDAEAIWDIAHVTNHTRLDELAHFAKQHYLLLLTSRQER